MYVGTFMNSSKILYAISNQNSGFEALILNIKS